MQCVWGAMTLTYPFRLSFYVLLSCAAPLYAQSSDSPAVAAPADAVSLPGTGATVIPPLTPIEISIDAALGSKISKSGDLFPILLNAPIIVDGKVLVPAGSRGMGEVVHAKKAGGSGAPGELVLAARYLVVGDRQIRLRSLNYEAVGQDKIGLASAVTMGAGPFGLLLKGGEKVVPQGTVAHAKTAEAFVVDPEPLGQSATSPEGSTI